MKPQARTLPRGGDADLVRRAASGEHMALSALTHAHGPRAWSLALLVVRDPSWARHAVVEGFAEALRRPVLGPPHPFSTVLLEAVYRRALGGTREARPLEPPARFAPSEDELLQSALRSLPERWRAAVWLSDVEGLPTHEVAAILGVSPAAAVQLSLRGRQRLEGWFGSGDHPLPQHPHLESAVAGLAALEPPGSAAPLAAPVLTAAIEASLAPRPASRPSPAWIRTAPAWRSERAVKPLSLACAVLLALGTVGAGVLGQRAPVPASPPLASYRFANPSPTGALGVSLPPLASQPSAPPKPAGRAPRRQLALVLTLAPAAAPGGPPSQPGAVQSAQLPPLLAPPATPPPAPPATPAPPAPAGKPSPAPAKASPVGPPAGLFGPGHHSPGPEEGPVHQASHSPSPPRAPGRPQGGLGPLAAAGLGPARGHDVGPA